MSDQSDTQLKKNLKLFNSKKSIARSETKVGFALPALLKDNE